MKHTQKTLSRMVIVMLAFAVTFTTLPLLTGDAFAHAVSAPAQVKGLTAKATNYKTVRLTWKKNSGKVAGYAIYRNGKLWKRVGKANSAWNVTPVAAGTKHSFRIRAYNTYKYTQYYNSTTKKWQNSRPARKNWKGRKTRKATGYKYGKVSAAKAVYTPPTPPTKVGGVTAKTASSSSIKITWTRISGNKNTYGYCIYRNGTHIKTVGNGTSSFTDTGLKASTSYTYQVRAYNRKNNLNSFGAYSDKKSAKTSAISANGSGGSGTSNDSVFAGSKLSDKTFYLEGTYNGGDLSFNLKTKNEDDADAIKWSSSKTAVATVTKSLFNGTAAKITIKGAGETTVTATNWDGQKKTCKITVKTTASGGNDPVIEEPDNGIEIRYGKVYPNDNDVFVLDIGNNLDFKIGNVETNLSDLPIYFPSGTKFAVNATAAVKETDYYLDGVLVQGAHSQNAYSAGTYKITNISDKSVIFDTGGRGYDASSNGVFFVNAGTCDITYSNGKTFTFTVTGKNQGMCDYRQYVIDFLNETSAMNDYDTALHATRKVLAIQYGPCNEPFGMVTALSVGGNCFAKAKLLKRLLDEAGIPCYLHTSVYNDTGARHMVDEIIIDGVTYIADPTNERDLLSEAEYESWHDANVYDNRIDSEIAASIVN